MTTLLDSGYLETDDPVVAACFLGCIVGVARGEFQTVTLTNVRINNYYRDYPILIPAAMIDTLDKAEYDYVHEKLNE